MNVKRRKGFTFIELMVSLVLLTIVIMALASTYISAVQANDFTSRDNEANNAINEQMALVWAKAKEYDSENPYTVSGQQYTGLDGLIAFYSQSDNKSFSVPGLTDATGSSLIGSIILYLDEQSVPAELDADLSASTTDAAGYVYGEFDLNGDGAYTDNSSATSGEYAVDMIPVEIRVEWDSSMGPTVTRRFMIISRAQVE